MYMITQVSTDVDISCSWSGHSIYNYVKTCEKTCKYKNKYSVSCAKGVLLAPLNSACSVLLGPAKLCMQTYKKCVDLESIGRVVYTGSLSKTAAVDMLSCVI